MKKIIFSLVFLVGLSLSGSAFAEITFNPASPQGSDTNTVITCSNPANEITTYNTTTGERVTPSSFSCSITPTPDNNGVGSFTYVEHTGFTEGMDTLADILIHSNYVSSAVFTWTEVITPPTTPDDLEILRTNGLFFPKDEITGESNANLLTASVGTSTATTFKDQGPIVAIVIGIILAFIVIRFIIGTVKNADDKKTTK